MQHNLTDSSGYTVSLELESKLPEDNVDGLLEDGVRGKIHYTGIIAFYRDKTTGQEKSVTAGDQTTPRRLRRVYVSEKTLGELPSVNGYACNKTCTLISLALWI